MQALKLDVRADYVKNSSSLLLNYVSIGMQSLKISTKKGPVTLEIGRCKAFLSLQSLVGGKQCFCCS